MTIMNEGFLDLKLLALFNASLILEVICSCSCTCSCSVLWCSMLPLVLSKNNEQHNVYEK